MGFFTHILDRIEGKAEKGQKRSSKWGAVRDAYLKENPACAICEKTKRVQVHHIVPFNVAPDLELDFNNLISLCVNLPTNCHLTFGHLKNFRSINPTIELDALIWRTKFSKAKEQF